MGRKIYFATTVAALAVIGFNLTPDRGEEQTLTHNPGASALPATPFPSIQTHAKESPSKLCPTSNPIFTGVIAANFNEAAVDQKVGEAFSNMESVIEKASNDPVANIALFRMASSCFTSDLKIRYQKGQNGCPLNSDKLPVRVTTLELLQKAADQGSDHAKLMYALNAPMTADYFRSADTLKGKLLAQEIMTRAKEFGDSAARAGVPDAYRYMSRAYESGIFGEKNIQLSYVYALPLRVVGSTEDLVYIGKIGERLNENMKKGAEVAAFGCDGNSEKLNTNSPF